MRYARNKAADGVAGTQTKITRFDNDDHLAIRRRIATACFGGFLRARLYEAAVDPAAVVGTWRVRLECGRRAIPCHVHALVMESGCRRWVSDLHRHIPCRACRLRRLASVSIDREPQLDDAIRCERLRELEGKQIRSWRSRSTYNAQRCTSVARVIRELGKTRHVADTLNRRKRSYSQVDFIALRSRAGRVDRLHYVIVVGYGRINCRVVVGSMRTASLADQRFTSRRGPAENLVISNIRTAIVGRYPK